MMSKNTLAAALASAGMAVAMVPATASATTASEPPSTTAGTGTVTSGTVDIALKPVVRKAGETPLEYLKVELQVSVITG